MLGCFGDYTGLEGSLVPRVPIDFDLDEEGRLSQISGFAFFGYLEELEKNTTWLANFDGFGEDGGEEGWWLEWDYDGAE